MKKVLSIILLCFLFSTGVQARLLYEGKEFKKAQETTIKGFLYDIAFNGMEKDHAVIWKPQFAKTIVWFERVIKAEKIYRLEELVKRAGPEAEPSIIRDATNMIVRVLKGEYPNISPEVALKTWHSYGKRVVAKYKKTGNKVYWKFKLKPKKNSKP